MASNTINPGTENVIAARYGLVGAVGVAQSVVTTISFDTLDYDTNSAYSSGTFTVPESGTYSIDYALGTASLAGGGELSLYIVVNGTIKTIINDRNYSASAASVYVEGSDTYQLVQGDTVVFQAFTAASGGANVGGDVRYNRFSIAKL